MTTPQPHLVWLLLSLFAATWYFAGFGYAALIVTAWTLLGLCVSARARPRKPDLSAFREAQRGPRGVRKP